MSITIMTPPDPERVMLALARQLGED